MATASYTTDLTAAGSDLTQAENTTGWAEPTATGWTSAGTPANQTENFIQGNASVSSLYKATGVGGELYNYGSGVTIPADGAFLVWGYYASMNGLETETNGGVRLACGNSLTAFYAWKVSGKDTLPYGGWKNYAANPAATVTRDYTAGSPSGTWQYFGFCVNATVSILKGEPFTVDAIRAGRCEARFAGGTAPDAACTFAGYAAQNDAAANRWGLIQAVDGGYLWKGLMTIGYGAACRFTDANTQVLVDRCPKVTAAFNKIEIRNASTILNWTNISFLALLGGAGGAAATASKGRLEIIDDCDVNISSCAFTNMDTFVFKAASDVLTSTFRSCGQITAGGANFAGTKFEGYEGSADSAYLLWNTNTDPQSKLANCSFTKGTAATHAISFTDTNLTTIHIPTTCTFSGYNASNSQNDSTVYIAKVSGSVTIYYDGTISYKSAGATVTISASQPTLTIGANVSLSGAEVRIYDLNSTLPNLGTELAGTENCPTATYDFTGSAANVIWIQVMKTGYTEFGQQVTMPSANQTLNISLQQELNA